jgi:hypothetical protein
MFIGFISLISMLLSARIEVFKGEVIPATIAGEPGQSGHMGLAGQVSAAL